MKNKLYEIFYPSKEKIEALNRLFEEIRKEAIEKKHCIVCKHYNYDANIPGFITYEGDCNLKNVPCFGDNNCPNWQLNETEIS